MYGRVCMAMFKVHRLQPRCAPVSHGCYSMVLPLCSYLCYTTAYSSNNPIKLSSKFATNHSNLHRRKACPWDEQSLGQVWEGLKNPLASAEVNPPSTCSLGTPAPCFQTAISYISFPSCLLCCASFPLYKGNQYINFFACSHRFMLQNLLYLSINFCCPQQ